MQAKICWKKKVSKDKNFNYSLHESVISRHAIQIINDNVFFNNQQKRTTETVVEVATFKKAKRSK